MKAGEEPAGRGLCAVSPDILACWNSTDGQLIPFTAGDRQPANSVNRSQESTASSLLSLLFVSN